MSLKLDEVFGLSITEKILSTTSIIISLVFVYNGLFGGTLSGVEQGCLLLTPSLFLIFLTYPLRKNNKNKKKSINLFDCILSLTSLVIGIIIYFRNEIVITSGGIMTPVDLISSGLLIVLTLEATRRAIGLSLVIISLIGIGFAYFGPYMPMVIAHRGLDVDELLFNLAISTNGIWGTAMAVGCSIIIYISLFSAFLKSTGAGDAFMDLGSSLFGQFRGGAAKISVVTSGMFGMINGLAVANVATTGTLTIPLMKRSGYKADFAGAVEATASSGGQLMPPIMGATAFIMAEILDISYSNIALAALIPGTLYFVAIFLMVDLEALKLGLKGLKRSQLPSLNITIRKCWHLIFAPILIAILIGVFQYSPMKSALITTGYLILTGLIVKPRTITAKSFLNGFKDGFKDIISITVILGTVGIIIGVINNTGVGLRIADILISFSGNRLLPLLIMTAVVCIILGMGVPGIVSYMVLAVLVAPALIANEINPIAAHLFIFYFGAMSAITPPVATASYVAAMIAKGDFMRTSFISVKLGIVSYFVPFVFVYQPALILQNSSFYEITFVVISTCLGLFSLSISLSNYFLTKIKTYERVVFAIGSLLLIVPETLTDSIGILLLIIGLGVHIIKYKNTKIFPKVAL